MKRAHIADEVDAHLNENQMIKYPKKNVYENEHIKVETKTINAYVCIAESELWCFFFVVGE